MHTMVATVALPHALGRLAGGPVRYSTQMNAERDAPSLGGPARLIVRRLLAGVAWTSVTLSFTLIVYAVVALPGLLD